MVKIIGRYLSDDRDLWYFLVFQPASYRYMIIKYFLFGYTYMYVNLN